MRPQSTTKQWEILLCYEDFVTGEERGWSREIWTGREQSRIQSVVLGGVGQLQNSLSSKSELSHWYSSSDTTTRIALGYELSWSAQSVVNCPLKLEQSERQREREKKTMLQYVPFGRSVFVDKLSHGNAAPFIHIASCGITQRRQVGKQCSGYNGWLETACGEENSKIVVSVATYSANYMSFLRTNRRNLAFTYRVKQ